MYVGRNARFGPTLYGNRAFRMPGDGQPLSRLRVMALHEKAVLSYAVWLSLPAQSELRARMSARLRGRPLACHCASRGLACHAEVIAVVANSGAPLSVLRSVGHD